MTIYHPFGGQTYTLGSSISSTQTTITLTSFVEPVSQVPYTMALLNTSIAYGTIAPKTTSVEFISFTGITQNVNGSATLTGVTRGLNKKWPFTADATFRLPHSGQSVFIISDVPQVWEKYPAKENNETITGQFLVPDPVLPTQIANKEYVDSIGGGGSNLSPNVGTTVQGNSGSVQVSSQNVTNVTTTGTNRYLIVKVSMESAQTVTGITYNGDAMALLDAQSQGAVRTELWALVNPDLGANTVAITLSGASKLEWDVVPFNQVNQVTPFVLGTSTGGSSTTSTGSVTTTTANSILVHGVTTGATGTAFTAGAGESIVSQSVSGDIQGAFQVQAVPIAAATNSTVNIAPSTAWANVIGAVNGIAGGGGGSGSVTSVSSSDAFIQVTVPTPNPVLSLDVIALADDATFINELTGQTLFQNNVNAFVTGGGGSGGTGVPTFIEDFLQTIDHPEGGSGTDSIADVGTLRWTGGTSGSSSLFWVEQLSSEAGHPGIVRVGNGGGGNKNIALASTIPDMMGDGNKYNFIIRPHTVTSGLETYAGIQSSNSAIKLRFDETTAHYFFVTADGAAVEELTDLGAYVLDDWYDVRFVTTPTSVTCSVGVNGAAPAVVGVHTTNIPPVGSVGSVSIATREQGLLDIDYFSMVLADITGRPNLGSGSDSEKKVGVGFESNTNWFNMQPLFEQPNTNVGHKEVWSLPSSFGPMSARLGAGNNIHAPSTVDWLLYNFTDDAEYDFGNPNPKKLIVEGTCMFNTDAQDAGWGIGHDTNIIGAAGGAIAVGFTKVGGIWNAYVGNGATDTTIDVSTVLPSLQEMHVLRIEFNPLTPSVLFYVDGILVATITTNLPTTNDPTPNAGITFSAGNSSNNPLIGIGCPSFAVEI